MTCGPALTRRVLFHTGWATLKTEPDERVVEFERGTAA
jgi:hypothetical protein